MRCPSSPRRVVAGDRAGVLPFLVHPSSPRPPRPAPTSCTGCSRQWTGCPFGIEGGVRRSPGEVPSYLRQAVTARPSARTATTACAPSNASYPPPSKPARRLRAHVAPPSFERLRPDRACPPGLPGALRARLSYEWRGNVRELENALSFAVTVRKGRTHQPEDLPPRCWPAPRSDPRHPGLGGCSSTQRNSPFELQRARDWRRSNRAEVASALGLSRSTPWPRMRARGIARDGSAAALASDTQPAAGLPDRVAGQVRMPSTR